MFFLNNSCFPKKTIYFWGVIPALPCLHRNPIYGQICKMSVWQHFNFMSRSSNYPQPSAMAWNDQSGQQNCSSLCDQVLKYLANHRKFCKTAVKKMQGIVCQARPEGPLACLAGPQLPLPPHLVMVANDLSEIWVFDQARDILYCREVMERSSKKGSWGF